MAKILKHFGLTTKKTKKHKSEYATQKSTSIHELPPKCTTKYQSNVHLDRCEPSKYDTDYDTRSLKIYANVNVQNGDRDLWLQHFCSSSRNSIDEWEMLRRNSAIACNLVIQEEYCDPIDMHIPSNDKCGDENVDSKDDLIHDHEYTLPYDAVPFQLEVVEINSAKKMKKKSGSGRYKKVVKNMVDKNLQLEQQCWYHGAISRTEAEILLEGKSNGTFLIRKSELNADEYSLSIRYGTSFNHLKIEKMDGQYVVGQFSQPFESINEIVNFYSRNRLPIKDTENIRLVTPCSAGIQAV